jgi:hypothetical protein
MKALCKSSLFRESGRGGAWRLVSCVGMCLTGQHRHAGGSPSCAACSCNTYCTCLDDISADAHCKECIHPTYLAALSQRDSTVLHLDVLTMLGCRVRRGHPPATPTLHCAVLHCMLPLLMLSGVPRAPVRQTPHVEGAVRSAPRCMYSSPAPSECIQTPHASDFP